MAKETAATCVLPVLRGRPRVMSMANCLAFHQALSPILEELSSTKTRSDTPQERAVKTLDNEENNDMIKVKMLVLRFDLKLIVIHEMRRDS